MIVNDYEWQMIKQKTGYTVEQLTERLRALIITLGSRGSTVHTSTKKYEIPVVATDAAEDPTGCGDAYRAGMLYGLLHNMDWERTGQLASLMGSINIQFSGTQNHRLNSDQLEPEFKKLLSSYL